MLSCSLLVGLILWLSGTYPGAGTAFRQALFQITSTITTTGLTTASFTEWPSIAPLLVLGLAVIGGCSGSTAGGLKVSRVMVLMRHGFREVKQLVHPKGKLLVKLGGRPLSESVVLSVTGFFILWAFCFIVLTLAMNAAGLDILSAFGAAMATLTNVGPGLGAVAGSFQAASDTAVWLGTLGMIMGRLEVFSVLVLMTPGFWKR